MKPLIPTRHKRRQPSVRKRCSRHLQRACFYPGFLIDAVAERMRLTNAGFGA